MTYDELVEGVITNTNRPELLAETRLAVKRSTIKMHNLDLFQYDLTQGSISFQPTINPRVDLKLLGPRFRKLAEVRVVDISGNISPPLERLNLLDSYKKVGQAGYLTVGAALEIKSAATISRVLITYYSNPLTQEGSYDSWIATNHPFAIIDDASAGVLASVGNNERAGYFANLVGSKLPRPSGHIAEILSSNPLGESSSYD